MRRNSASAASVLAVVVAASVPAQADAGHGRAGAQPSPWKQIRDESFSYPAGTVCEFPLRGDMVNDGDWVSVFERFPDGKPRREVVVGPFVIRMSNATTGQSVVRDFGGTTEVIYRKDGGRRIKAMGGLGIGIYKDRDPHPPAQGYYVAKGYADLDIDKNDVHRVLEWTGPRENLCETLG